MEEKGLPGRSGAHMGDVKLVSKRWREGGLNKVPPRSQKFPDVWTLDSALLRQENWGPWLTPDFPWNASMSGSKVLANSCCRLL